MTRVISGSIVAAMAVVGLAANQAPAASHAPGRGLVLVPVSGTWNADYETLPTHVNQVLTIDGAVERKAPDAKAAATIFPDGATGFVTALAAPGAFPLAVVRDIKEFKAGKLSVQFKLVGGATDQTAGILFNLRPDGSYTYARYNTKDGNVAVWKFENGARTVLMHGAAHEQLPLNVWHTLDVEVNGLTVTATANGRLSVIHKLDAPVSGRVGVWTKVDSVTTFRLFQTSGHGHHTMR